MAETDIGRTLRAIRERRGWGRETLAHHAGVSGAAIAQIEAGRRPNPRLSTMVALSEALGVTVEQLTGRAAPAGAGDRLQHRVLLYESDTEFLDATVPYLTAGLEQSDALLAVTAPARIRRLRRALGSDAERVSFRESAAWYSSPRAALDSYRAFLHEQAGAGRHWVRILGEPHWEGRSARELRAWARYESMLNLSLAESPATIMCPYDTKLLSANIVAEARCTHPEVTIGSGSTASPSYISPEAFLLER
jgi:transcriptional regulator with XRE-family HTH domain